MSTAFFKMIVATTLTLSFVAMTGCTVTAEESEAPVNPPPTENPGAVSEALMIGGGGASTALWCACKLDCDNTYSGIPVLIKACKNKCDADKKCRTGVIVGGSGFVMY